MELNLSPVLTTRNYGINSARVDDSIFCPHLSKFENVRIENAGGFLSKSTNNCTFLCEIGEKFDDQLKMNCNSDLNFFVNKSAEKPIVVHFCFDEINHTLVERLNIVVKAGVCAKVVVIFDGEGKAYHNGLLYVNCNQGAKVDVAVMTDLKDDSTNILRLESELEKDAILNFNVIDFGSSADVQRYHAKLVGENAISNLNSLYVAGGESFVDLNYIQDVYGQRCQANIQTIGCLLGNARKHFKGTINFEKGCKKSVGCEEELCLLLSKTAKSKALPMLLCTEEDVDGKHSSSVGKVGDEELFYIMSRGLSHDEALKMLVKAKFNVVLEKIFDEQLREKIAKIVDRKLSDDEN